MRPLIDAAGAEFGDVDVRIANTDELVASEIRDGPKKFTGDYHRAVGTDSDTPPKLTRRIAEFFCPEAGPIGSAEFGKEDVVPACARSRATSTEVDASSKVACQKNVVIGVDRHRASKLVRAGAAERDAPLTDTVRRQLRCKCVAVADGQQWATAEIRRAGKFPRDDDVAG